MPSMICAVSGYCSSRPPRSARYSFCSVSGMSDTTSTRAAVIASAVCCCTLSSVTSKACVRSARAVEKIAAC